MLVATVLTVYGIETRLNHFVPIRLQGLQQYLPFTVLKLFPSFHRFAMERLRVATVLTVYGIETVQM